MSDSADEKPPLQTLVAHVLMHNAELRDIAKFIGENSLEQANPLLADTGNAIAIDTFIARLEAGVDYFKEQEAQKPLIRKMFSIVSEMLKLYAEEDFISSPEMAETRTKTTNTLTAIGNLMDGLGLERPRSGGGRRPGFD